MSLPPASLPLRFSLQPSIRSANTLVACVSVKLRDNVSIVRLLDPEHREPYVGVGRMFRAMGMTPLGGLIRFDLRKPGYDVDLAGLAPFKVRPQLVSEPS